MGAALAARGARSRPTSSSACRTRASPPRSASRTGSGIPYGEGLAKNRYVGRTFISPSQTLRQQGIRLKLNPLKQRHPGQAPRRGRRLDRARQHDAEARRAAARGRRRRGAHAHHVAAGRVAVLLRHRHRHAGAAHRVDAHPSRRFASTSAPTRWRTSRSTPWSRRPARRRTSFCLACFDGEYPIEIPESVRSGKLRSRAATEREKRTRTARPSPRRGLAGES